MQFTMGIEIYKYIINVERPPIHELVTEAPPALTTYTSNPRNQIAMLALVCIFCGLLNLKGEPVSRLLAVGAIYMNAVVYPLPNIIAWWWRAQETYAKRH
jgi:hypothetical protein